LVLLSVIPVVGGADRLGALTGTTWGVALLIKVGVLAAVAGMGAWNWRVVLP
jgi:hypothetical protein